MRYECQNINPSKLLLELKDVGIIVGSMQSNLKMGDTIAKNVSFEIDDAKLQLVQQIIDAHNPLQSIRDDKINELSNACNRTILGRFKVTIDGTEYEFSYDYEAQSRFNGIGVLFFANKIREIEWTAYENGQRVRITLNQDNFDVVTLAALHHQNYNVTKFNQLLQQVNSATTKEQIEAITWDD